jgi:hypothetical protein
MEESKHFGITVTNQNYSHEEIKSRLIQEMLANIHLRLKT